ncbi:MOSC domain-containing protein isoform 2 [Cladophialophora immunda]|nr:MOSC domain-containing protein isoform 2 [Cladophialophora immunda]
MATMTDGVKLVSSSRGTQVVADLDPETGYITNIDDIREAEYPQLNDTTYLDHAGTSLYAKSLIQKYSEDLTGSLFGNPHSASASSQLSSRRIDDARLQVLRFFNADPGKFDLVFVPNATAAIKLVGDAFRDHPSGFNYYYHAEAHTSLVGVRELATGETTCFANDREVEAWLEDLNNQPSIIKDQLSLFAYPAQSNMTGRRLPLKWTRRIRDATKIPGLPLYTLLDAAALVSTAPFDLSDDCTAPDFTALSFYKIFGFPDLGALIVRKSSGDVLRRRKYFGGGTVDSVAMLGESWHAKKFPSLHSSLEDGTVAFHSIIALQAALDVHRRLYGSMENVSKHANFLAATLRDQLRNLHHANGSKVCAIHSDGLVDSAAQGPTFAFNLKDSRGRYISNSEVEKLGIVKNIQFRTGGLCNPGGIARDLGLSADELRQNYAEGQRCGDENDIINGKPTGAIRLSLGAMSNMKDVVTFIDFIKEFYVDHGRPVQQERHPSGVGPAPALPGFVVESLSVFPIKSCAAYRVPCDVLWEVGPKGLAWDREWCLVHEGTNVALSQKRFPRMALIRPEIDLQKSVLRVSFESECSQNKKTLHLSLDSSLMRAGTITKCERTTNRSSNVCGENVEVHVYTSPEVVEFFTEALGVPCTLARFPNDGTIRQAKVRVPGLHRGKQATEVGKSIALSNESPILLVSRSSVNRLNEQIKQNGGIGRAVTADSFRGNIVIAEDLDRGQMETPYIEDEWTSLQIGEDPANVFEVLGPCQRCQMVCVDQKSAQRRQEPFSTLAKTRRKEGRVWFGMHMCLKPGGIAEEFSHWLPVSIRVGDRITPWTAS